MHDTVTRIRRQIREESPREAVADTVSERFQACGLSRALTDPLGAQFELLYREAHAWLRLAEGLEEGAADAQATLGELLYVSRRIRMVLDDLIPFLERVEDNLSERDDITHRESAYEREVAPFSRLDSTQALRSYLASHEAFGLDLASVGAQVEADLLKIAYLEKKIREAVPKPLDLFAMVVELLLDSRRHLAPAFEEDSSFMTATAKASGLA